MKKLLAFLTGFLLLTASPAFAAWGVNPFKTGTNWNHGTTHTVSLVGNTTVAANDILVILGYGHTAASTDTIAASDTASDTFTTYQCQQAAGQPIFTTVSITVTAGMTNGTVSISDDVSSNFVDGQIIAYYVTGGKTTSIEDTAARACGGSTTSALTSSLTSGTPANSGDLFIGMHATVGTWATFTEDASWTAGQEANDTSSGVASAWITNAGTGTKGRTVSWTSTARTWVMNVLALSPPAAASAACTRTLLGVGC